MTTLNVNINILLNVGRSFFMQLVIYIVFNLGMDDISFFTYDKKQILFMFVSISLFFLSRVNSSARTFGSFIAVNLGWLFICASYTWFDINIASFYAVCLTHILALHLSCKLLRIVGIIRFCKCSKHRHNIRKTYAF